MPTSVYILVFLIISWAISMLYSLMMRQLNKQLPADQHYGWYVLPWSGRTALDSWNAHRRFNLDSRVRVALTGLYVILALWMLVVPSVWHIAR